MVAVAYKNRTREEIIAAFRESIRKKQEWIKQSDEEFKSRQAFRSYVGARDIIVT